MLSAPTTYKCQICSSIVPAKTKSDHLIVHFKDKISPLLAKTVPFTCPKCRYVALDRSSLIRHFATRHGLVQAFLKVSDQTETCMQCMMMVDCEIQTFKSHHPSVSVEKIEDDCSKV